MVEMRDILFYTLKRILQLPLNPGSVLPWALSGIFTLSQYKLGWVLKDKNPTTFYPPLNPLPRGDFSNSPLERGKGCVHS